MNALGLDVTTVGNHEFDEGSTELLRMQNGGCRTNPDGTPAADSCPGGPGSFPGADFPFLSANVVREDYKDDINFGGGRVEDVLTGFLARFQIDF